MLVQDLMTSPVVSLLEDQDLPLARGIMELRGVRHLPVIDAGRRLVGVVSQRDLLAAPEEAAVGSIMTRDVLAVRADVNASIAAAALLDHKFGCLPVVDEDGLLVGIVTVHDFLRLATVTLEATD